MFNFRITSRLCVVLLLIFLAIGWKAKTAQTQSTGGKPVEQVRKNIQVLKRLPDFQLFLLMNFVGQRPHVIDKMFRVRKALNAKFFIAAPDAVAVELDLFGKRRGHHWIKGRLSQHIVIARSRIAQIASLTPFSFVLRCSFNESLLTSKKRQLCAEREKQPNQEREGSNGEGNELHWYEEIRPPPDLVRRVTERVNFGGTLFLDPIAHNPSSLARILQTQNDNYATGYERYKRPESSHDK
jgi:hypothetical protein